MKYFTASSYYGNRFNSTSRQLGLKAESEEEFRHWKQKIRGVLKRITGIQTMTSAPLLPEETDTVQEDGYTRTHMVIQTEPGIFMPIFVLKPQSGRDRRLYPAVIAAHGHAGGGKMAVAGIREIPEIAAAIDQYNYAYGIDLVRQGFIVFCPDTRGFGERRETGSQGGSGADALKSSCFVLNAMALPLGQTVTGMWVWDLMRLIDYIETRQDCDAARIGCAGLSGGGLQTLWLTALDDRIKCAVISGYFYGYKQSLLEMPENCSCNYVPGLWEQADMGDIGACIAPRPLLIETGDQDELNGRDGVGNVTPQVEITKKAYRLFNAEDKMYHHVFCGGHRWDGRKAVPWLKKHLLQ
jgi:dienelactone hydrolase